MYIYIFEQELIDQIYTQYNTQLNNTQ